MLNGACPAFFELFGGDCHDWRDLVGLADSVRPMLGISSDAWNDARATLGLKLSAAALAIIVQKQALHEIQSPGSYLRAMTDRHRTGQLRLDFTIKALALATHDPAKCGDSTPLRFF